ncbi:MAG: S49 family peptidase [Alphaproteobacteria bacterium]|nr:S49 family peptidase [Alphaproteobacteria bacterium]
MIKWLYRRLRRLNPYGKQPALVAVIRLNGTIAASQSPFSSSLSLASLAPLLSRAFESAGVKAVAFLVNSPGGAAAQSSLIFKRIRALAQEKSIKVFAFCEDVAASGGYMLACAADEIYADESSIVGSIGVISGGFGFDRLIEKLGVDRRTYPMGEHKDMLDPFRPERPEDVARLKEIQGHAHNAFIALVKERRGSRLKGEEGELFSGAFWSGRQAETLGLIDGIGDLRSVMRRKYGEDVYFWLISGERGWWLPGVGVSGRKTEAMPGGWAQALLNALEARLLWSRFGL